MATPRGGRGAPSGRRAASDPHPYPHRTPPPALQPQLQPHAPNRRHAKPQTPLLSRRFWRLVIDEAQAVQARSAIWFGFGFGFGFGVRVRVS